MKICILADAKSIHTKRWVLSLSAIGHQILVITYNYDEIQGVIVKELATPRIAGISPSSPFWSKYHYLFAKRRAQQLVKDFGPDLIHAFWATSYGFLLARLNHPRKYLSVWGQDVSKLDGNFLLKWIVKFNLSKVQCVFCTSEYLINLVSSLEIRFLKKVKIPFGVDEIFLNRQSDIKKDPKEILIGSTKSFEWNYGLDILLQAVARVRATERQVKILLVGSGSRRQDLLDQSKALNLSEELTIIENAQFTDIPDYLDAMDIFVMPSREEAFGVAALEAAARGLPVVGADVGGIPEVIIHGKTGLLVPPEDVAALANALIMLIDNPSQRKAFGVAGREMVIAQFRWEQSVEALDAEYHQKYESGRVKFQE